MRTLERERAALHAAFAEQRARETDLRHQTRRDSLTGLANRVLLQERLEELLAAEAPLCVVFCDLDDFKRVNDTHGHAVGDEVLRAMGARLARRLAAADVVARIGGDEFVVVAAGVRQQDAPGLLLSADAAAVPSTGSSTPGTCRPGPAERPDHETLRSSELSDPSCRFREAGPAYGVRRQEVLVVIGGGPYGIAAAAQAIEAGIETVVVGRPFSFWTSNIQAGMYLRSGPDWHLDASQVHTFEAFLDERGIKASDVDPVPIATFLVYAGWFQHHKHVAVRGDPRHWPDVERRRLVPRRPRQRGDADRRVSGGRARCAVLPAPP